jgi:hypothetical protein
VFYTEIISEEKAGTELERKDYILDIYSQLEPCAGDQHRYRRQRLGDYDEHSWRWWWNAFQNEDRE